MSPCHVVRAAASKPSAPSKEVTLLSGIGQQSDLQASR